MNWMSIVTPFAKPLGAIINKAITACAAGFLGYAAKAGWPMDAVAPIVSMVVLGISTLISGLAATQGITIPIINDDNTNGAKVVASTNPGAQINGPMAAPAK